MTGSDKLITVQGAEFICTRVGKGASASHEPAIRLLYGKILISIDLGRWSLEYEAVERSDDSDVNWCRYSSNCNRRRIQVEMSSNSPTNG